MEEATASITRKASLSMKPSETRIVYANSPEKNALQHFCSNYIVTSKYTWWNFLPKFLFETFRKIANAYFLLVSIMQGFKKISNTNGVPSTLPTLMFIVTIDAIFSILEDRKRAKADAIANSRKTDVLTSEGVFVQNKWADVVVGDIIKLHNRDGVPADMVILAVHEPAGVPASGICYVETKSLDGETNLKLRQALEITMSSFNTLETLREMNAIVECETPNKQINKFSGSFSLGPEKEPIPANSILLRGCTLRNTEWLYGLVINTGPDTKIMMSNSETPSKLSTMDSSINGYIIRLVALLWLCCAIGGVGSVVWNENYAKVWYLEGIWEEPLLAWFVMFCYLFLLMYQFVPISLYVSMNMVKYAQAHLINWDKEMYYELADTPAAVRTMSLNEELGQISYVFTDKTGTLTCNIMDFRRCSIGGTSYGNMAKEWSLERKKEFPYVNFEDAELRADLQGQSGVEQKLLIQHFFIHLALCHTVLPERNDEDCTTSYSASSPDEQALVSAAKFVGYEFLERSPGLVRIKTPDGTMATYKVVNVLEFNSTRKRMSVAVRDNDNRIWLLTKGADSIIFPRLKEDHSLSPLSKKTAIAIDQFATEGLRTLVIAQKEIAEAEYREWEVKYRQAVSDLNEIEKRKRGLPNKIDELMDSLEVDFDLLGATAIEDKLQEEVPNTISSLSEAGIRIWVLTGDKEETAINIGHACRLLHRDMQVVIINMDGVKTPDELGTTIVENIKARTKVVREFRSFSSSERTAPPRDLGLVIDGEALELVTTSDLRDKFLELCQFCKSVIACRVSPAQKAELVSLVRYNIPTVRTLAIGDGANDVSMIQTAHIGVGISGQEGMQAVNASDYAISRFHFLRRLLLVHGRWNYRRMSNLVVYMFYKNILLTAAQYFFAYNSGFSGQKIYPEFGIQLYNICYTGLPIVLASILDRDVSAERALKHPKLYYPGPRDKLLNHEIFAGWIISALLEAMGITWLCVWALDDIDTHGRDPGMFVIGAAVFTLVVIVANAKLMLIQESWVWLTPIFYAASIGIWFFSAVTASQSVSIGGWHWLNMIPITTGLPWFWPLLILVTTTVLLYTFAKLSYKSVFAPEYNQLVKEVLRFDLDDGLLDWDDGDGFSCPVPILFDEDEEYKVRSPTPVLKKFKKKLRSGFAFSSDIATAAAEATLALRWMGRESAHEMVRRSSLNTANSKKSTKVNVKAK